MLTRHNRLNWAAVGATWLFILVILGMILLAGSQTEGGIANSNSGGNTAALVLAAIAILPLFISQIRFVTKRWIPWVIGGISLALGIAMSFFSLVGPQMLAWSMYGGLQVLKAGQSFNDLAWILRWAECDGCEAEDPGYGQGVLWIKPLTFGQVDEQWAIPLGFALIVILSAVLYWLARSSSPGALPLYALAGVSSAWLLLLDRANVDSLVFLVPVVAVLVYRRNNYLVAWTILAAAIWWLGTWKLYPFGLGILLMPALFLKRGWLVISGFLIAVFAYLVVQFTEIGELFSNNQVSLMIEDFPAFGRTPIVARMGEGYDTSSLLALPNVLVIALAVSALIWGFLFTKSLNTADLSKGMLAIGGSGIFLTNVLVGGFGFAYKGPFLLLAAPLLALGLASRNKFVLYSAITSMLLIALSLVLSYSILLTSLASILVVSLAAGAGASTCYVHINRVRISRNQ